MHLQIFGIFYNKSKLDTLKYMKIHLSIIKQEITDKYRALKFIDNDGYMYVELTQAMYGLTQSDRIENQHYTRTMEV